MLTNAGGAPGDALVLTKPLGAGAVATAIKRGLADDGWWSAAIEVMTTLNDRAARRPATRAPTRSPTSPASACSATCTSWRRPAGWPRRSTPPRCPLEGVLELLGDERALAGGSQRNRADAEALHLGRRRARSPRGAS